MDIIQTIKDRLKPKSEISEFDAFQNIINKETWDNHDAIFFWAENLLKDNPICAIRREKNLDSLNEIEKTGLFLKKEVESHYSGLLNNKQSMRVLIHLPPASFSPGGNSLFSNAMESLNFIGITSKGYEWDENLKSILSDFQPTFFLTSDHPTYLDKIDWNTLAEYKMRNGLKIGLTASLEEHGNTPLVNRLEWAKKHNIDFFYSFQNKDYLRSRNAYKPFYDEGYSIHTLEFGANPLHYYPTSEPNRDIDYIFLASSNPDKWKRYFEYLPPIVKNYAGFIDGPGWRNYHGGVFNPDRNRLLYSRGKIGINLHIDESINYPCELNERTYILAACGIPQLVDNPKLMQSYFGRDCCFIGESPTEYEELFPYILENPDESIRKTKNALIKVFKNYTTFHRAESFIKQLLNED